ncbi:MAG TPA: hypothetical protein VNB24_10150 [Acidimicrobiales bacterium]|nr:hypothetical protein [Acidimicrobiales bacterium]
MDDAPHTTEPPAPLENLAPPPVADYQTDYGHDGATEDDDPDGDETVFELNDLSMEQRRHLEMRLTGAKVVHRWEVGSDLVVNSDDADAIEAFLDEVEHPDGFGEEELEQLGDLDEDVDDEAVYKAMSDLYVAADRLQHAADDAATAGAFHLAADGVTGAPPPFGFDPRVWEQVKGLSSSLVAALNADADPEVVERDAHSLRQILANFV